MFQVFGFIGEDGENKVDAAALSTDTLPTTYQGRDLAAGSVTAVYDATGAAATTTPTFKRLTNIDGTPSWRPMA